MTRRVKEKRQPPHEGRGVRETEMRRWRQRQSGCLPHSGAEDRLMTAGRDPAGSLRRPGRSLVLIDLLASGRVSISGGDPQRMPQSSGSAFGEVRRPCEAVVTAAPRLGHYRWLGGSSWLGMVAPGEGSQES